MNAVDHDDFDRATLKILRGYRDKRQPITRLPISISQSSGELVDLGEAHALTLDLADQRGSLLLQFRKRTINVDASDGNERLVGIRRRQEGILLRLGATTRTPAPGCRRLGVGSSVAGLTTWAAAIPPDSTPQPRQKMAANMRQPRLASRTDGGRIKSGKIDVLTFGMIWFSPTLEVTNLLRNCPRTPSIQAFTTSNKYLIVASLPHNALQTGPVLEV